MSFLFLVLLIGFAVFSLVMYQKAKKAEQEANRMLPPGFGGGNDGFTPVGQLEDKRERVTVQNLRIGDIVSHFGQDFVVEGKLDYNEDGWTWTTFMLVDGDVVKWLSVEIDDQLEVGIWEEIDLAVPANPPEFLEYQGEQFRMVERGSARVTQTGTTGRRQGMHADFYEYEGSGERSISVEVWGSEVEVSIGEEINPYSLEIYPGADAHESW